MDVFALLICLLFSLLSVECAPIGSNGSASIDISKNEIQCLPEQNGCSKCYIDLVKYIVYDDRNLKCLQETFFPPSVLPPVFVIVRYHIAGKTDPIVWYWTEETSIFLYPLEGFQFTSLFFGVYSFLIDEIDLYLPQDCLGLANATESNSFLQLLTHRLKAYAMTQTITTRITDDYDANSHSLETLREFHKQRKYIVAVLYFYQFFIPLFTLGLTIVAMCAFRKKISEVFPKNEESDNEGKKEAIIISVVVIAFYFSLYAFVMDLFAIVYSNTKLHKNITYFENRDDSDELSALFVYPNLLVGLFDFITLVLMVTVILSILRYKKDITKCVNRLIDYVRLRCGEKITGSGGNDQTNGEGVNGEQNGDGGSGQQNGGEGGNGQQNGEGGNGQKNSDGGNGQQNGEGGNGQQNGDEGGNGQQNGEGGNGQQNGDGGNGQQNSGEGGSGQQNGEGGNGQQNGDGGGNGQQNGEGGNGQQNGGEGGNCQQNGERGNDQQKSGKEDFCCWDAQIFITMFALGSVVFILSTHSYFILIAFINNPLHANSVGIFYVLSLFTHFLVAHTTAKIAHKCCSKIWLITVVFVAVFFILPVQILIAAVYITVPIKRAIDDIPAQISAVYQSLTIAFGILITYYLYTSSRKRTTLEEIIEKGIKSYANPNNVLPHNAVEKNSIDAVRKVFASLINTPPQTQDGRNPDVPQQQPDAKAPGPNTPAGVGSDTPALQQPGARACPSQQPDEPSRTPGSEEPLQITGTGEPFQMPGEPSKMPDKPSHTRATLDLSVSKVV